MTAPIAGFICALVLAAIVIAWITYCMFFRERHKTEVHYDITDLRQMNYEVAQEQEAKEKPKKKIAAGIFIIPPRRHKQKDDYEKRPDYPESPPPQIQAGLPGAEKLVEIFNEDTIDADVHFRDGICNIESNSQYHSEV